MPRFYSKVLTKTLAAFVEEACDSPIADQTQVIEELALMRHGTSQVVALYDAVVGKLEEERDPAKAAKLREAAAMIATQMKEDLKEVAKVCETAARIEAMAKDKVSVHSISHVVNQMVRLMHTVCGEENVAIAEEFERRVREEVKLPSTGPEGTNITPDMDVLEMDDLVPRAPGE